MGKMVVVLRTFSKIFGLAGLRIGYGIAKAELIANMNKVRQPFNVNSLAQIGARAALNDSKHIEMSKENNRKGLDFLFGKLQSLGYFCLPTQANFFLIKVGNNAADIYERLLRKGVIVRPMKGYSLDDYIRVTVGLPEENRRFIEAFQEVVGKLN
jgi:histidinol-phosphate aminotransferase